jgi:transaldolase
MAGPVFYQLQTHEVEAMEAEAKEYLALAPNLGIKIMCSLPGLEVAAVISSERLVAVTGVFTPAQVYLSAQAGAHFVIPYVNRITRFIGDGPGVVSQMADILIPTDCEILAASIKSPEEAVETLIAGADHISAPLQVIERMAQSDLTDQAREAFDQAIS